MIDHRPNFLVIGAARSSTTAVARALADRPEVFLTTPKETHFWAFTAAPRQFSGPGDDEMFNRSLVTDPDAHLALYSGAGDRPLRGDGSVTTMYHPVASIEAIRAHAHPDVRLVCLLREPAKRSLSAYLYLRSRGFEQLETFEEGLAAEEDRIASGHHHMWHYRAMSRYGDQLPAFVDAFGDRLLVAVSEEVQADPRAFSDRLCDHLGIPREPALDLSGEVNRGGEPRSASVARAMSAVRRVAPLRSFVTRIVPARTRERIRRANLAAPAAIDLGELRSQMEPHVALVESVLGRRVDAWHAGE